MGHVCGEGFISSLPDSTDDICRIFTWASKGSQISFRMIPIKYALGTPAR